MRKFFLHTILWLLFSFVCVFINAQAPSVTINQALGQSDPASGSPIHFTVTFDQAITGFTSSDVSLSGTAGATIAAVTEIAPNNGTTFNVAVSGMTASGTVIASISANVALNSNNVGNTASSSTDNTVTFVTQSPDLTISKASNTSEVSAGEEVGFTITVTNAGTGDALNATITDALPAGLNWTLTSSPPGFSIVANVLSGSIGTLAAGENIMITITAFSNAGSIGPITNTATVSCTNEPPDATSNNSSTATITVLGPDIMVVKTANSSIVNGGGTVGFTITITNIGSGTAFGATVNDALPAGLNWTLTSPPSGFSIAANTLSGYISTLAPGASVAVTFTAVTATGYSGLITNTATVSCTNESVSAVNNNSSTATITVVGNTEPPTITCPGNITTQATSSSGAVVNYELSTTGLWGTITSLPASGSTFPIGITTVNVYNNASQLVYGLSGNRLITFSINDPSVVSSHLTITGLQTGESVRSIDFRPANGQLYGIGATSSGGAVQGRLYTINTTTGAATQVGSETFPLPFQTFGSSVVASIDFEPVTGFLRLVCNNDLNMRLNPDLGTYTIDGVLDPGGAGISGIAYSNNVPFASSTTLYDIGREITTLPFPPNVLYIQDPNKGNLVQVGTASLGISTFSSSIGFDISQTGTALASAMRIVSVGGQTQSIPALYSVNLVTGFATFIGEIGANGTSIEDISIAPANHTEPSCSFTITVTPPPPTVTINKAATQFDPTTSTPIRFTVVFNEDVTGFDASDISFAGSTVPGTLVATVTGAGPTYGVTITGITGAGNLVASITAGAAVNNGGASSLASTSTDNIVQVVIVPHDLFILKTAQDPNVAAGGVITYFVTVVRIAGIISPALHNVTVTDVLPSGTSFVGFLPVSVNSVTPLVFIPPQNQNTLGLVFPIFGTGDNYTFRLQVRVDAGMTGSISNTATVGGPLGDINPANNSATALVQIVEPPTITCPSNVTLYASAESCTAAYTILPEHFTVTGGGTTIAIDAENGPHVFGTDDLTSNGLTRQLRVGTYTIEATATNAAGTASCTYTITVIDNTPPTILQCSNDIIVNNDPGKCSALVEANFQIEEKCSGVLYFSYNGTSGSSSGTGSIYGLSFGRTFSVGEHNLTAVFSDDHGNSSSCSFKITVVDNEKPVITTCPGAVTIECVSQIPAVNIVSVSATDNCGTPTITHAGDVITDQTCANRYTLTRTYKATDGSGNTAACTQIITVDDRTPPTITGLTPSKRILAPPNHKMVDIILAYTISDNCVSTPNVTVNITSNEPVNGTGDGDTDPDWEVIDSRHIRLRAERSAQGTGRVYTITVTVSDGCNAPVSATTEVMVVHNITGPHSGNSFKVGSTVAFTGEFWDVPGNKHTAKWTIDGTSISGVVTEPAGTKNGKITGSYKFTTPGVYKLQMNVTDQKGVTTYANTNGDLEAIIVIYDPNGGYTYGGGFYNSPVGALIADPSSTGKASYGFAMNYFKNSTNPKGETQFEFKVGEFEFNALNFDYLVISNSMAQFKGTGKIIGGQSGVAFTMTVTDGQLDGSGIDKIRMKIYNKNNGKIIYDNQPGASDAALPTQAVGANSIVVISGINSSLTSANTNQKTEMEATEAKTVNGLDVIAYPNPSINNFSITVQTSAKEKIMMQVVDMYGRIIETRNVSANSITRFGDRYRPGTYFVRIIQGKEHKEIKLVKLSD